MEALFNKLKSNPVVYVTRDLERALGLNPDTQGYFIISNSTAFAKRVAQNRTNILLISANKLLNTAELLRDPAATAFIKSKNNPSVLVFKTTGQIERICETNGWRLINPPAVLAEKIEAKITQVETLKNLKPFLLEYQINKCKDIMWSGTSFILQFDHSHTGGGTYLIDSETKLKDIIQKFPEREARISRFVDGPIFTNNNVLADSGLIIGNISYQITGLEPFTDNAFATVGNDWGLAKKLLSVEQVDNYKLIVKAVSEELMQLGWYGLFGADVILNKTSDKMYLLEINARQPASTTFESWLQRKKAVTGGMTIFAAHLAALLGVDTAGEHLIEVDNGAQIIQRVLIKGGACQTDNASVNLHAAGFDVIEYDNPDIGAESLRIQSDSSIMDDHNQLNQNGEKIARLISSENTLSAPTRAVIESFLHLKIGGKKISCPYFNNARAKTRGGLRVATGKGSATEIQAEAALLAKKAKINLSTLNEEQIKKFLVGSELGIDCSGFVYYTLAAELKARGRGRLATRLSFSHLKNIWRRLIARLRPVQNTDVMTFAQKNNSQAVKLAEVKPADIIVMLKSGAEFDRNHILLVETVKPDTINYVHSFAWSTDGQYNHGVRRGAIKLTNPAGDLLAQTWIEKNKTAKENETYLRAKDAQTLEIRRLNI